MTTSSVVIDWCMPQPRQIEVVVDESPSVIDEVASALDRKKFDVDVGGRRVVGRCGVEPVMAFQVAPAPTMRIVFQHHDPVFGWSNSPVTPWSNSRSSSARSGS